jgi:hypothetical protein
VTDLEALMELAAKATQLPWMAGRNDTLSYHAEGGGPYKNVYADDPDGKFHMGERLPAIVCEVFDAVGADCRHNAEYLAAACNAVPSLIQRLQAAEEERDRYKAALKIANEKLELECLEPVLALTPPTKSEEKR